MDEIEIYFELDTSFSLFGMYFYKVLGIGLIEAQELDQYKFLVFLVEYQLFLLNPSNYLSIVRSQMHGFSVINTRHNNIWETRTSLQKICLESPDHLCLNM